MNIDDLLNIFFKYYNASISNINFIVNVLIFLSLICVLILSKSFFLKNKILLNKKRLKKIKNERKNLQKLYLNKNKKSEISSQSIAIMKTTVEKFKMQDFIEDVKLKLFLAKAGYRNRSNLIVYIFFRIVLPPIIAIIIYIYFFITSPSIANTSIVFLECALGAVSGFYMPSLFVKKKIKKRQGNIRQNLPDFMDLIVICVESGMGVEQALNKVIGETTKTSNTPITEEFSILTAELSYLGNRNLAYNNFAVRTGLAQTQAMSEALAQAEKYGTSVSDTLRILAKESRQERVAYIEKAAATMSAKMTLPMMLFFMPVIFSVILGPAIVQYFSR
jgi:tight adherence protein C